MVLIGEGGSVVDPATLDNEGGPIEAPTPGAVAPPASLEELVERVDGQMAEELETKQNEDPDADQEEVEPAKRSKAPAGIPPALQAFVDKNYGGDWEAYIQSQHESRSEVSRLRAELEEMKSAKNKPEQVEARLKELKESDEDFQSLNQELTSVAKDWNDLGARNSKIITECVKLDRSIAMLEGKIEVADEGDKVYLRAEKAAAISEKNNLVGEHDRNERDRAALVRRHNELKRSVAARERDLRGELDAEEEREQEQKEYVEGARELFRNSFSEAATEAGLKPGSAQYNRLYSSVKAEFLMQLRRPSNQERPALTDAGVRKAVKQIVEETASTFGLNRAQRAVRLAPTKVPGAVEPVRARTPEKRTPSSEALENDAKAVKDRARRIFAEALGGR